MLFHSKLVFSIMVLSNVCGVSILVNQNLTSNRYAQSYFVGWMSTAQGDKNLGRLRLAVMPQTDPAALIQFIKDNVDRTEVTSTPSSVPATGCGSSIYKEVLEKALNIE